MNLVKVILRGAYRDKEEKICEEKDINACIEAMTDKEDAPYFIHALNNGGYFRGETKELPNKVKAFCEIEELEIFNPNQERE